MKSPSATPLFSCPSPPVGRVGRQDGSPDDHELDSQENHEHVDVVVAEVIRETRPEEIVEGGEANNEDAPYDGAPQSPPTRQFHLEREPFRRLKENGSRQDSRRRAAP